MDGGGEKGKDRERVMGRQERQEDKINFVVMEYQQTDTEKRTDRNNIMERSTFFSCFFFYFLVEDTLLCESVHPSAVMIKCENAHF